MGGVDGTTHGTIDRGQLDRNRRPGTVDLGNTAQRDPSSRARRSAVGGIGPGEGNVIAFNAGRESGRVQQRSASQNPIRGNSIYGNGTGQRRRRLSTSGSICGNAGSGLTLNDDGDADVGPNTNQNFPLITSAVSWPAAGHDDRGQPQQHGEHDLHDRLLLEHVLPRPAAGVHPGPDLPRLGRR